jgi:hypothetical protein
MFFDNWEMNDYSSYSKNPLIKSFCLFLGNLEYIWKDEWTSAIHFIKFLWKEKQKKSKIICGEFDCWPKRFMEFLNKRNAEYK